MAVTATKTVRDIVTAALRKAQFTAFDEEPASGEASVAMEELDRMLKGWQTARYNLWTKTSGSLALTTAASYTLDPVRPLRILSARFKPTATASELPMISMTRDEYDELPNKAATGTPTQYYFDKQREAAKLFIWPVLSSATAQTIEYTYERELEDITSLNDTLDMPGEWWDAVVYNLAARMQESMGMQSQMIVLRAEALLIEARADDTEGSVFFGAEPGEY